ncbi:S-methyl-5'-thioinosine phosphorylase [Burkholderiaceae bacterium FT117]|uniref:S-methyl-5'-thioinosine phosphorylase n=1 Tax=Zeimonas sediminis TaxID=2944268 RepID=UPI0023430DF5|nr:S-methyl-5'-thioinosine phosphorylase [Zeimonas sediminis]MCM5569181.1 S-methyl-5'-thioinosine phosphorylase [Zeimonas sediminis]
MLGIIGGSGLARLAGLGNPRRSIARTPWGDPSCALTFGELDGREIVFLARHGYGHTIAPHEINYRANVWALRDAGVEGVVSVATVGGIGSEYGPGAIVVADQIVDYTHGRRGTYFDGPNQPVTHIDFTEPYDRALRARLLAAAARAGETAIDGGVYGCTQGPRLETAAEIRRLARDGCDLVGMTGMPEAALARELDLPYAALCVVANHAAGTGDSAERISLEAIAEVLDQAMVRVRRILSEVVRG